MWYKRKDAGIALRLNIAQCVIALCSVFATICSIVLPVEVWTALAADPIDRDRVAFWWVTGVLKVNELPRGLVWNHPHFPWQLFCTCCLPNSSSLFLSTFPALIDTAISFHWHCHAIGFKKSSYPTYYIGVCGLWMKGILIRSYSDSWKKTGGGQDAKRTMIILQSLGVTLSTISAWTWQSMKETSSMHWIISARFSKPMVWRILEAYLARVQTFLNPLWGLCPRTLL